MTTSIPVPTIEIFPWNENFLVGIDTIDQQHRVIINLLNELAAHAAYQKNQLSIKEVIKRLVDYMEFHFRSEENVWEDHFEGDPWLSRHRKSHNEFLYEIKHNLTFSNGFADDVTLDRLVVFLTHWITHHILESDRQMAKVVKLLPTGISLEMAKEIASQEMGGLTQVLVDTIMSMYDKLVTSTVILSREIHVRSQIERELNKEKELAEKAHAMKSAFLANLSHEIRSPLAAIASATLLLKHHNKPLVDNSNALHTVNVACTYLIDLANNILDLSKIEAGKFDLNEIEFDIESVIKDTISIAKPLLHGKQIKILFSNRIKKPYLIGDPLRVQQALLNYLSNAIKHTNSGYIKVKAKYEEDTEMLTIEVMDTGVGISAESISKLFNPYVQLNKCDYSTVRCSGLGLTITKEIISLMGGEVGAHSEPNKGSTFWFRARLKPSKLPLLTSYNKKTLTKAT